MRSARALARMTLAFFRLDAIDDLAYPLSVSLRYLGLIVPLVVQFFVGNLVGDDRVRIGSDYFTFAAIGLTISAALSTSLSGVGTRLQQLQNQGVLEALLVLPAPWTLVPMALSLYPAFLAVTISLAMLVIATALGANFVLAGLVPFLVVLAMAIVAALAIGILSSAFLVVSKRSSPILRVYGMAATLFGGAVFPVDLLPPWLRWISWLIPHTYAIQAGRSVLMAQPPSDQVPVTTTVIALFVFDAVVLVGGVVLFNRALRYARRLGVLGTY